MRIRRTYLTAILATAAAAAMLAAPLASPQHVQLSATPIHDIPLEDWVDVDVNCPLCPNIPNVNGVPNIGPNINVPNVNLPNINPGQIGLPGRGR
jgi:hypothetical protein